MKRIAVVAALIAVCFTMSIPISAVDAPVFMTEKGLIESPPRIGTMSGPQYFAPNYIVIHNSASFPYDGFDNADMWAGYRRYHMQNVHPGVWWDENTWAWHQDSAGNWYSYPAQEGFPDGLTYPGQKGINDIDYTWGVPTSAGIDPNKTAEENILTGRDPRTVGWHAGGFVPYTETDVNAVSWGVCFVGDFDLRAPDDKQYQLGVQWVSQLMLDNQIPFDHLFPHYWIREWQYGYRLTSCPGQYFPWQRFFNDVRLNVGGFWDLSYSDWEWAAVQKLSATRIVTGFQNQYLYPDAMLTRAEFCNLIWKSVGSPTGFTTLPGFTDVSDSWAYDAILWCKLSGIIRGYSNSSFRPNMPLTRAELCAMIYRWKLLLPAIAEFSDVPITHWAVGEIGACQVKGYIKGYEDGTFKPDNFIKRAEAFQAFANVIP